MTPLYKKIQEADSLVIASPVYWFNFSAQTKIFLDRLYAVGIGQKNILHGKNTAFILTFADVDPFTSGAINALRTFQDICRYLEANIEGIIYGSAYAAGEIRDNRGVMDKAISLGRKLASLKRQIGKTDITV